MADGTSNWPDPAPRPGLAAADFTRVGYGGIGDGHNSFAHSMAWFKGRIYVGATRSNLCMLRHQTSYTETPLKVWPIECPETRDEFYATVDRRAQIWAHDPADHSWERVYIAPEVLASDGNMVGRDIGYRSMEVFHGPATSEPALYVSTWAPGRAPDGGLILRSTDGRNFEPVTPPGIIDDSFATTRSLTTFKGRMHFAPTAQRDRKGTGKGDQQNYARPVIFAADSPEEGNWEIVNEPAFGDETNRGIFTLAAANDQLYAGTLNLDGLQVWVTDGTLKNGGPEYVWRKVCEAGAGRGPLNQAVASMCGFRGALYVGTGIQGGGNDRVNKVGPAAAEILRINADDSVDVIVGDRDDSGREPLSGLPAGFGQFFNGYMWSMAEYDGWLYCGTYDSSITLRWAKYDTAPTRVQRLMDLVGTENLIDVEGGADLWRSADGDNWLPVNRRGFGNPYNWGFRNLVSTPNGLFVGTANVFGPKVAVPGDGPEGWVYQDNPFGGMELWQGSFDDVPAARFPTGAKMVTY